MRFRCNNLGFVYAVSNGHSTDLYIYTFQRSWGICLRIWKCCWGKRIKLLKGEMAEVLDRCLYFESFSFLKGHDMTVA